MLIKSLIISKHFPTTLTIHPLLLLHHNPTLLKDLILLILKLFQRRGGESGQFPLDVVTVELRFVVLFDEGVARVLQGNAAVGAEGNRLR